MIVVDTHLAVCLLLPGNADHRAEQVRPRTAVGLFRGCSSWNSRTCWRVTTAGADEPERCRRLYAEAEAVLEKAPFSASHERVLELSLASGCPSYGCEFVGLAEMLDIPLATTDRQVLQVFRVSIHPQNHHADIILE